MINLSDFLQHDPDVVRFIIESVARLAMGWLSHRARNSMQCHRCDHHCPLPPANGEERTGSADAV